jgi:hypothetical protein
MGGTAGNYLAGDLGIGVVPQAGIILRISKNATGATNVYGVTSQISAQSDVTSGAYSYYSGLGVAAAAFTLTDVYHYAAIQGTFGAGSTVTNQSGFYAGASLTGATNNYGFRGVVAAATGRYNLYMDGTADNYLAGNTGIGGPATAGIKLTVTGGSTNSANPAIAVYGVSGSGTVSIFNDLGAGSFNSIVSAGSKGIIAAGANSTTSRASLVIAPWSDVDYGIRIEGGSTTNILHYGTAINIPSAAASVPSIVRGKASQSANLQEWQNSSSTVMAYVDSSGNAKFVSIDGGSA